jgi:formate hydrogenlyase subunit 3/multisubunit Na+/H+ antiporter MnhD subunit
VVAAAFYLLLRLWAGPLAVFWQPATANLLGAIGIAAMLWGGVQALLQRRLKMLVAYSTVSQFGFLMLVFPLGQSLGREAASNGVSLLLVNHALAKAALFLAAGTLIRLSLRDRVEGLTGARGAARWSWLAVILAGGALLGLPPSLGFQGKWLLLQTAVEAGAWVWLGAILAGTLLTFAYLARLIEQALLGSEPPGGRDAHWALLAPALVLATLAMAAGLLTLPGSGWFPCC